VNPLRSVFNLYSAVATMSFVNARLNLNSDLTSFELSELSEVSDTRLRRSSGVSRKCDVVIVGGGIVGLSLAWQAALAGRSVTVIDREERAFGATTRNFGMIWPIGQPLGPRRERAERSRDLWLELARLSGFGIDRCGSMHVACSPEEVAVLLEFSEQAQQAARPISLVEGGVARSRFSYLRSNVRMAMMSNTELVVDPREVPMKFSAFLREAHGVEFLFGSAVTGVDNGVVRFATGESMAGSVVIVCPGDDMRTLFPQQLAERSLVRCKLQMQRTVPQPRSWRLGPHLAGGLTLLHYEAFRSCPSITQLAARMDAEYAEYRKWGIHVMVSQNAGGECVIGDSHEYGGDITQFEKTHIDDLVLEYLRSFVRIPDQRIEARWSGFYAKDPAGPHTVVGIDDRTVVVTGLGGAGMTLGPVLGEELWPRFAERDFADPSVTAINVLENAHV
jgi:D-hydroxyproline dehydrogenase subunit beta